MSCKFCSHRRHRPWVASASAVCTRHYIRLELPFGLWCQSHRHTLRPLCCDASSRGRGGRLHKCLAAYVCADASTLTRTRSVRMTGLVTVGLAARWKQASKVNASVYDQHANESDVLTINCSYASHLYVKLIRAKLIIVVQPWRCTGCCYSLSTSVIYIHLSCFMLKYDRFMTFSTWTVCANFVVTTSRRQSIQWSKGISRHILWDKKKYIGITKVLVIKYCPIISLTYSPRNLQ